MERFNRTLEAMLAKVAKENQRDWDLHIPKALFCLSNSSTCIYWLFTIQNQPWPIAKPAGRHNASYSPYRINFGRSPNLPVDIMLGRALPPEEEEVKEIPELVEEV